MRRTLSLRANRIRDKPIKNILNTRHFVRLYPHNSTCKIGHLKHMGGERPNEIYRS